MITVERRRCRRDEVTQMGRVPEPHRSPLAPRDRDWDWSGTDTFDDLLGHGGWSAVANAHAWHDPDADPDHDPPRQRSAYKLPHHEIVDGRLRVVWRGVVAAMTVVNGARGGVDIPDGDRQEVYRHLAAHYEQFDEEPPPFAG
jgi:hypothetical protein